MPMNIFKNEGLKKKTIETFRVGYAPNEWRALSEHLQENRILVSGVIEDAGLSKKPESAEQSEVSNQQEKQSDNSSLNAHDSRAKRAYEPICVGRIIFFRYVIFLVVPLDFLAGFLKMIQSVLRQKIY